MIFMRKTVFLLDFRFSSFPDYKKSRSFVRFHPPASFGLSAKAAIPIQCKPGSPNTMAQRIQSFKDHPRTALTMGTTRPPNQLEIALVAQTRLPTLPLGGILREKTHGLVRFHPHQRHLDEATPLRSTITALQITMILPAHFPWFSLPCYLHFPTHFSTLFTSSPSPLP